MKPVFRAEVKEKIATKMDITCTVKELIDKLKQLKNKDKKVMLEGCDCIGIFNGKFMEDGEDIILTVDYGVLNGKYSYEVKDGFKITNCERSERNGDN